MPKPKNDPNLFDHYLDKHSVFSSFIQVQPELNLDCVIVIPVFDEPDVLRTINCIYQCQEPPSSIEIIAVINASEKANATVHDQNKKTYRELCLFAERNNTKKRKLFSILKNDFPDKHAGVGWARKTGMDEAIRRFKLVGNDAGIIISMDADTLVDSNYLIEIEKQFSKNRKTTACSIYFEHPIEGDEFEENIYFGIIQHELYLRYYIEAMRYAGHPYACHTIGSCFAVRADIYASQGGMNRKQGGEDFYFLHKVLPLGDFAELNTTKVIPSPRPSGRVPFGTGPVVSKRMHESEFLTYRFEAFEDLKEFFLLVPLLFNEMNVGTIIKKTAKGLSEFLIANNFDMGIQEIKRNTSNKKAFIKRFYNWFDAFRVLKYLNFVHEKHFSKQSLVKCCARLLKICGAFDVPESEKQMLLLLREKQRNDQYFL